MCVCVYESVCDLKNATHGRPIICAVTFEWSEKRKRYLLPAFARHFHPQQSSPGTPQIPQTIPVDRTLPFPASPNDIPEHTWVCVCVCACFSFEKIREDSSDTRNICSQRSPSPGSSGNHFFSRTNFPFPLRAWEGGGAGGLFGG